MPAATRLLTWNLQGEVGISKDRLQRQLDFLEEHTTDIDLFLFQAVHSQDGAQGDLSGHMGALLDYFSDRGYHVAHTGDWAQELAASTMQPHADIEGSHNRCNLTASRWPIERRPLPLRPEGEGYPSKLNYYYSQFPEKILVGEIDVTDDDRFEADQLESWNVGIINGAGWGEEKLNMLETVYASVHLRTWKSNVPVLLGGDFNAPKRETADCGIVPHGDNRGQMTAYPFYGDPHYLRTEADEFHESTFKDRWRRAESRIFDPAVGDWEMRDVYWIAEESPREPSTTDHTHEVTNATPSRKRLDHVLVSDQFDVRSCEIWNAEGGSIDGLEASDHAPVFTELYLQQF